MTRLILGACLLATALSPDMRAAAASDSAVADAAMRGDAGALRALIQKRADVNVPQADGATALHWAVYRDDLAMVDLLLGAGAKVKTANREGATPLSLASISGNAAMIEKLLKARAGGGANTGGASGGANPNDKLPNGETPLMLAARAGSLSAMKALLDAGADVNAAEALRGTTALMWAAEQKHPEAVRLLIARGADVNARSAVVEQRGARPNVAPTSSQRAAQIETQAANQIERAAAARARGTANPLRPSTPKVGGMTALLFAARQGDLAAAQLLVDAKAQVNQTSVDGWSPLLIAAQNRHYTLGSFLLDQSANPNQATDKGWTALYLTTDNRNIEGGEYPVPQPDMDHLDFIKRLLDHGADPNARSKDYTETRNNFTMQWLNEDGATPFLRAAQSGDVALMKLLLSKGADAKIATRNNTTALMVAAGIGWVEGITYEWSPGESLEAVKMCLELGIDVNAADGDGRTALHGAAHKGRNGVVQFLVDRGAKLDAGDNGSRDTLTGLLTGRRWMPVDYADGLVRVGVQSAIPHPETAAFLRKLMKDAGLPVPAPSGQTICVTPDVCK
ncbi:MAG: ankyrin repeat domain-containing protein [Bryobacterales bacterium]|nr:ankyrin repeat domain-containing protein [Bryobacterales bacterium]